MKLALAFLAGLILGALLVATAEGHTPWVWTPVTTLQPLPAVTPRSGLASPVPSVSMRSASPSAPMRTPSAESTRAPSTPRPSNPPRSTGATLSGLTTHYAYFRGAAAAGWRLRRLLGPDWRGSWVRVCLRGGACLPYAIHLTDYMSSRDHRKVLDLSDIDFAWMADRAGLPFGIGVLKVTVEEVSQP